MTSELLILSCLLVAFVEGTTTGFMDLNLLKKRAEKIPNTGITSNFLNSDFRIVTGMRFTCSGSLTSLLLGVDVRPGGSRNLYPEVQIWRKRSGSSTNYDRQGRQEIRLAGGDFSPDGVLQYNLNPALSFQNGDVLGVWQPASSSSVVRIFRDSQTGGPLSYETNFNPSAINVNGGPSVERTTLLIYAITTGQSCTDGFPTPEELRQKALEVNINSVVVRDRQQRVFLDITFTCNGSITKWIVGAGTGGVSSLPSELQIWRRSGQDYTKVGSTQLTAQSPTSDPNVYEYIPSPPLGFQEGDILGVYQRTGSSIVPYYQVSTGPRNFRQNGLVNSAPNSLIAPPLAAEYDYPLVTVEIDSLVASMLSTPAALVTSITPVPSTTNALVTSITPVLSTPAALVTCITPVLSSTAAAAAEVTCLVGPSIVTATPTPSSTLSPAPQSSGNVAIAVAAVVVVLIVIAVLVAVGVAVVLLFLLRKKRSAKPSIFSKNEKNIDNITNPTYSLTSTNQPLLELYSVEEATCNPYEAPISTRLPSQANAYKQSADVCSPNKTGIASNSSSNQWGMVVPTMSQRNKFTNSSCHYETQSEKYQTLNDSFFEEEVIYWEPGSDCASIYEQLSRKKFREIIREQIQVKEHLGSGQFGQVNKGVWSSPDGPVDVAIKMLRAEASEMDMIKFLQEAAIMGQFHHPNIALLHGVVTVGEPTMIVLELVKNRDLRDYLLTLQPTPGKRTPPSLPQQLLEYCRQIASGMEYLSKKSFVHRDLAARNILVDDKRTCKISDFGMSRDLADSDYYVSQGGQIPIKWTAPEALRFKKYSTASDVWSFGVLMYEIWSLGHKPFEGKTNHEAVRFIEKGYRLPPPPGCPRAVYQLMMDCWHPEASRRPSFGIVAFQLSQPETQLLQWTDKDKIHPQSTMLGALLETASDLHSDLQQQYL